MSAEPNQTSATLLQKALRNDASAWQRLVNLYTPMVRYWCGRWGCPPQAVDDVIQDVFLAAATSLASFRRDRPGDSFRGWLRGITRHSVLGHFRRLARQPQADGGTDAQLRLLQQPDTAGDDTDPPEVLGDLHRRALDLVRGEFEPRTWQMFWLTVVEGRAPVALAEELGVQPAAIRMAKSRVLRRLKEEIGDVL